MRARDRFVTANLRLAVSYVARRCNRLAKAHGGSEDLVQAANMGLITAAERFDPARGYRFSTYAYWWIRQAVNRWVDQHSRMVSIPGSHCQHLAKVSAITRRVEREQGRLPTHQELATELGVSLRVLEQVLENGRPKSSHWISRSATTAAAEGWVRSSLSATWSPLGIGVWRMRKSRPSDGARPNNCAG
jgi:RNA polymerase primary sigma factor